MSFCDGIHQAISFKDGKDLQKGLQATTVNTFEAQVANSFNIFNNSL
jgi:CDGSH-type Zn-finger protein